MVWAVIPEPGNKPGGGQTAAEQDDWATMIHIPAVTEEMKTSKRMQKARPACSALRFIGVATDACLPSPSAEIDNCNLACIIEYWHGNGLLLPFSHADVKLAPGLFVTLLVCSVRARWQVLGACREMNEKQFKGRTSSMWVIRRKFFDSVFEPPAE